MKLGKPEEIGKRLRSARLQAQYATAKEFASAIRKLGYEKVSDSTYFRAEGGEYLPGPEVIAGASEVTGRPIDWFYTGREPESNMSGIDNPMTAFANTLFRVDPSLANPLRGDLKTLFTEAFREAIELAAVRILDAQRETASPKRTTRSRRSKR